jgi:hypothetical protein
MFFKGPPFSFGAKVPKTLGGGCESKLKRNLYAAQGAGEKTLNLDGGRHAPKVPRLQRRVWTQVEVERKRRTGRELRNAARGENSGTPHGERTPERRTGRELRNQGGVE